MQTVRWICSMGLVIAGGISPAMAQAPDEAPDELFASAEPASAPPPAAVTQPRSPSGAVSVGKVIDGWKVVAVEGEPRQPDGRPSRGICGFVRDVLITQVNAPPSAAPVRTTVSVPCTRVRGRIAPAAPRLAQSVNFVPADNRTITRTARLSTLPRFTPPAGAPAATLIFLVKVQKDGRVFDAHLVKGTATGVDALVTAALSQATFVPARAGTQAVDSIVRQEIPTVAGPPLPPPPPIVGRDPAGDPVDKVNAVALRDQKTERARRSLDEDQLPPPEETVPAADENIPASTSTTAPPAEPPKKTWPVPDKPFLKGELSNFGTVAIENPQNSLGVGLGAVFIDNVGYASVRPNLDLHYKNFHLGIGAPLRFQILTTENLNLADPESYGSVTADTGRFRSEDWDQLRHFPYTDALRPLRYLRYGKKEDHLYVDVTRVHAQTIGHGQLMRRYTPNIDINKDLLMAEVDGYLDFGGVELIAGPLPIPRLVGGLIFVKPLGLFLDDTFSKSLSIGVSYVTDLNTPTALVKGQSVADGRTQLAIVDAIGEERSFAYDGAGQILGPQVQGVGVDAEVKVFRNDFVDVKLYADYSHLLFPASAALGTDAFDGGGATVGGLLRLSFGAQPAQADADLPTEVLIGDAPRELLAKHAFRLRVEGRGFSPQYLPSYFNALYEADKFQFGGSNARGHARAELPTKFGALAANAGEPWRAGYYVEGSYQWVPYIAVTAVFEDAWALSDAGPASVPQARNLAVHAETLGLGWFQLFASYHFRNISDVIGVGQFQSENEVFFSGLRWRLLPFLFINVAVQRTFAIGYSPDDSENMRALSANDDRQFRFSSTGLKSAWSGIADIELGWQF